MIEVKNLYFSYNAATPVLEDVSFQLQGGDCLAILGINGAGKSTLLKCLNRIHNPSRGKILLDGEDVYKMYRKEMAKHLAYVPQTSNASQTMVFDFVLLGRKPYIRWDVTTEDKAIVEQVLEQFHLTDFKSRYVSELSGGEMQRVVLARAMAQQPEYLLLDEPTSSLDPKNQHEMMAQVQQLCANQKIGAAIVIHDLNLAARYCNRFLFLKDTHVYTYGDVTSLCPETLEAVYGMKVDVIEHNGHKLIVPI